MLGMKLNFPLVIGHEAAGVITKLGPGVTGLKEGDAVALKPWTWHALLTNHVNHPAALCVPLPAGVTCEQGAFVEPLAVGLQAVRRAGVKEGDNVVVLGSGPVGLSSIACARALGAKKIVATDLAAARLEAAKRAGADVALDVSGKSPMDAAMMIAESFKSADKGTDTAIELGSEFQLGAMDGAIDCIVDAAGFSQSISTAVYAVKPGGTISVVGLGAATPNLPLLAASIKEVNIHASFAYGATGYEDALGLIAAGKVDVNKLISHKLPMDKAQYGFEICAQNKDGAVKVMFEL